MDPEMSLRAAKVLGMIVLALLLVPGLFAQGEDYEPGPDNKLNSNLSFALTAPVNPTAKLAHVGWGFVYGAGYNFSPHHSLIGEIMWNRLYPTTEALAPIRAALSNPSVEGHSNLFALTGNYRLQFQRNTIGAYLIGGAGMYYRNVSLSQQVSTGKFISCTPEWLWWGFTCSSGLVVSDQTIGGTSSFSAGGNVGVGATFKLPESWWKFYVEARYHYAANKAVTTQVIPVTFGIRF